MLSYAYFRFKHPECLINFKQISISYVPLISESVPLGWYKNREETSWYIIITTWLLCATVLSQAYESNLLASLVKVDLEKQPQTSQVIKKSLTNIQRIVKACT